MQKLFITVSFILVSCMLFGQEVNKGDDGIFYGADKKPYTGTYQEFHPNGQLKTSMPLTNGVIDGEVHIYYDNGLHNEIRAYKEGEMHGKWITWNETGQQIAQAQYNMGEKDGKWFIWDENGTLLYDMTYLKGQRTGTWKMFDAGGNLIMEKTYE